MAAEHRMNKAEDGGLTTSLGAIEQTLTREQDIGEVEEETSWIGWQSTSYLLVLGAVCVFLASLTNLWWIVPVLGVVAPLVLVVLDRSVFHSGGLRSGKAREQELLETLAERGEITPATAAMRTSLTVDEASKMLGDLVSKDYLKLQMEDRIVAYCLPEQKVSGRKQSSIPDRVLEPTEPGLAASLASERLIEPLSERELEVLTLLASGRTNSEIAKDLFVALGTVKSHINNIYRKLEAKNRAEAVGRARELNLLR